MTLTDTKTISNDLDNLINSFQNSLTAINEACINDILLYESYLENTTDVSLYDATLLKEKMKAMVMEAVPYDI